MPRLYTASTMPNTRKVKNENNKLRLLEVRNCSTRRWSSMRCKRSPISLMKKSEMSEMLIRVEMCRSIFERIKSMAVRLKRSVISASSTNHTNPISFPPIPVSTMAWVRNGKMSCSSEPSNNPSINCVKKRLYFLR